MWRRDSKKSFKVTLSRNPEQRSGARWTPEETSGFLRPGRVLILVAVVAALVRLVFVLEIHDHLYWLTPQVDAADFHQRAMQVADGLGLGQRIFYKAPAYPYLVGQLYRLVGPSLVTLYVLQMIGGIIMTMVVAAMGVRLWGPLAGLIAGLLLALHTELAYFENQALIEAPALVVSVLAAALLFWGMRERQPHHQVRWRLATLVGCGALLGLALQLRPINASLILALVTWLMIQALPVGQRLRHVVFLLAPVLLLLIPTLRHNRQGSGEIIPVSVNGGINFYIGNNPDYDDTVAIRPGLRWEALTRQFGDNDKPVQWQRNYYRASWDWIRSEPADYVALQAKKFVLFWNVRTIDRNQDSSVLRRASWAFRLAAPWGLLAFLGIIGMFLAWNEFRRSPLHLLVLLQMAGVLAFFVTTRYRLAVVPWLALASAFAVHHVVRCVRQRDGRRLALVGVVGLVAGIFIVPDYYGIGKSTYARPDFDLAQVQFRNGLREEALASYRRAAQQRPDDPDVMAWYGEHLERMGYADEATAAYERAIDLVPTVYKPALSLGALYLERGDLEEAWRWLSEADRRGDDSGRSLYNMALVRERQKRHEEALTLYRRSLQSNGEGAERGRARLGVARSLLRLGRGAAALADLQAAAALSTDPDFKLDVAAVWIEAKRPMEALEILNRQVRIAPTGKAYALQARALALQGHIAAARTAAQQAVTEQPENGSFQALLTQLQNLQAAGASSELSPTP